MNTTDLAMKKLKEYVDDRMSEVRPFRAIVTGQSTGMVQIRPLDSTSGQTALRARCVGFDLATDDEVLCQMMPNIGAPPGTPGLPVVIAKFQRAAATAHTITANLTITGDLTVTGTAPGGSITVKDDGVSVDTDINTLDFAAPLTVSETPENEANIGVDVGTSASQVAAGNHTHAADVTLQTFFDNDTDQTPTTTTTTDTGGTYYTGGSGSFVLPTGTWDCWLAVNQRLAHSAEATTDCRADLNGTNGVSVVGAANAQATTFCPVVSATGLSGTITWAGEAFPVTAGTLTFGDATASLMCKRTA